MTSLELLAPARNADIGIAAIDCGADAVYIAGPSFGARKDAGNPVEEIGRLCAHAHKFGARIFVTFNILVRDDELEEMHAQMLAAQKAGADAFIIRDFRCAGWKDITVPLHASTQCAIHTVDDALRAQEAGCSRVIVERQLSLKQIREIAEATLCEVEAFVHGALCMSYSGQCTLSEYLTGRSADRGECIQACRSLYDLKTTDGKTILKDKAILSLKDFNLIERLSDLAGAGVSSFKIEGRLKSISYVKNVVLAYSRALDKLVETHPDLYRRASFGRVSGGWIPDLGKTFNREYTELFLDGEKGQWSSMDAPKSIGERIGRVRTVSRERNGVRITLESCSARLCNGDGFAYLSGETIVGFRADVAEGRTIFCRKADGLKPGMMLHRNLSAEFEKTIESQPCRRAIDVEVELEIGKGIRAKAVSADGRTAEFTLETEAPVANDRKRMEQMLREGLEKKSGIYDFHLESIKAQDGAIPLLKSSQINGIRRTLAENLDILPCLAIPLLSRERIGMPQASRPDPSAPLMRSKYCIRWELGMCPKQGGGEKAEKLILLNNGRTLEAAFDCRRCEMSISIPGRR